MEGKSNVPIKVLRALCRTCHASRQRSTTEHLIPGVSCEACHGPGANQEAMMKSGQRELGIGSILNPGRLDPVDLVDFCGACHRTFMDVMESR